MAVEHDLKLVALAALFCLTASLAAFRLYQRGLDVGGWGRAPWIVLTGVAAGSGVWATHFIAMLAYEPSIPVGYAVNGTVASFVIAIAMTAFAFALARPDHLVRTVAAGLAFGCGVAAMHYSGMSAFQPQGQVIWDLPTVAISVALGLGLSVAAMLACGRARDWRRRTIAGGLLTLAICGLHFTAMSAATIVPDPTVAVSLGALGRGVMAMGVGVLTAVVLIGAAAMILMDWQSRRVNLGNMRLLFDANPAPMWLLQPRTLAFLSVNDATLREYGYTRAEFAEMTAFDILHPDEHAALQQLVDERRTAYEGERPWRHRRADGVEVLIQPFIQMVPHGGGVALLAALFDVTARERGSVALVEAKEAAEAANRAKSDFLANMSHEIRTPLNGVMGIVGALERTDLSHNQREMVSIINASATSLQRLLADILETSRIEAGEVAIETRRFDLRALVDLTAKLHASGASDKGVAFTVSLHPDLPDAVMGDPGRVGQVLGNLLSNAVKFTSQGRVDLTVATVGDRIRFEVSDTGIGFNSEFQTRLFNRFEQADGSITRQFGGAGLGLAIARDLAVRMGGALTARSTPGQGSTFVFEAPLPASALGRALRPAPPTPEAPLTTRPMRVLLADDHPVNRKVVELMLSAAAVDLISVENGQEAVDAFAGQAFDLVLMDLQMPVMDGLEAVRQIRRHEASQGLPRTPIQVLSANALSEHVQASIAAGADAHLSKPIDVRSLLGALEAAAVQLGLAA